MATLALGDSAVWPKAFANLTPSEASLHQTGIRVQVPCFGSCLKKTGAVKKLLEDAHQRSEHLWLHENHTREHWTVRCFHNVRSLCFARFSRWKQRKHAIGKSLLGRKRRKRRFCDQCCRIDVKRKIFGTVLVRVLRVTENPVVLDEISENIFNEELDKLLEAENADQRRLYLTEYDMEIQNLKKRRNSEKALF